MTDDDTRPPPEHVPGHALYVAPRRGRPSGHDWVYTPSLGEGIAELYADAHGLDETGQAQAGGLWGLHYALPDRVPPPGIVKAWMRQFPAFGLLMREAEKLRAERLIEEAVIIADTAAGQPARIAVRVAVRQYLAERLDRARWGAAGAGGNPPALGAPGAAGAQPVALDVSDDQLAALALAAVGDGVAAG